MKKIVFILLFVAFTANVIHAQTTPITEKTKAGTTQAPAKTIKTIPQTPPAPPPAQPPAPAPAPPPAATNKTTGASTTNAPIYSLTAVRVKIRTGNDNKEFPSKVLVTIKGKNVPTADWSPFSQLNLDNEMRINSETEFGLERQAQMRGDASLNIFQSSGVKLIIEYLPNWMTDAWKIESVSLTLEFKDQFGNLHPTLGSKTIVFSNAYGFLNNDYRYMECFTDGNFVPLTAQIRK